VKFLLAALQGAVFGLVSIRLVGSLELEHVLIAAITFPIAAITLSHIFPRVAAGVGLLMALFWTGTCGYAAYEDPSLEAWPWIPVFALGGLLFGALANAVFFVNSAAFEGTAGGSSQRSARPGREHETPPPGGSPSPPPLSASEPDPWAVLGVTPTASSSEITRAFRALMALYHPDKVATMGPEIRALADEKSKAITLAYASARKAASRAEISREDPGRSC
jgi:hypothetical protein